jgi:predicted nucleotidyltransferase/DNA-binding XRE family transcriptional regulator
MESIGEYIRRLRENKGEPLRKVAAYLDVDQAVLSKIERGKRKANKKQVVKLAKYFGEDEKKMLIVYLSDRILYEVQEEDYAKEALKIAEERIEYKTFKALDRNKIIKQIKNKLKQFSTVSSAWIFGSFARGEDDYKSDIDIMIQVTDDSKFSLFDLAEIQYQLEKNTPYKIDVVMKGGIKPNIMNRIKPDLKLIYER